MPDLTPRPPRDDRFEGTQISLLEIAGFLVRRAKLIVGCALGVALIVAAVILVRPRYYTSSASFTPQSSDRMSSLAGLAAQFGVVAGGPDVSESPGFYADLLRTREVLTAILLGDYRVPRDTGMVTAKLIDLMKVKGKSPGRRLSNGMEDLNEDLSVEQKARTGVVSFRVRMKDPMLAQQVAQRFLDEVSRFSLEKRNSKASAERRFTEGRTLGLQEELRVAENRLQSFLQRNRDYGNSPDLSFQHDRLRQEVDFLRGVRTTVAQAYEKARMDEVRDTPVLTAIDKPDLPAKPDGRGLVNFGILALILGGLVGVAIGFAKDYLFRSPTSAALEFQLQRPADRVGSPPAAVR